MDLQMHLDHLLKADPADRLDLLRRVAALGWREGWQVGYEHDPTADEVPNPYREQ